MCDIIDFVVSLQERDLTKKLLSVDENIRSLSSGYNSDSGKVSSTISNDNTLQRLSFSLIYGVLEIFFGISNGNRIMNIIIEIG